ncbi:hypothetical protein [Rivularia sp. UHCC 0363]|uniref:hypothetical protein n=1 Tax=Rivularia sp. UHCC 0363 TaxID=3110244 RepID=UPI002B216303|nr:hypothetical protein [Rivularia sp. UHCC 0363]MEA5595345.1 hypothetical protein [Rivularia sp. UHCC 0363]
MRTITNSVYDTSTPPNQPYSASVPLSVYRELAAELQAAQIAIHQLNQKNEYLAQENYVLRQEITKTVNAVLHLQDAVSHNANAAVEQTVKTSQNAPPTKQYKRNTSQKRAKRPRTSPVPQVTEFIEPLPETVFIEEQEASYYYADESQLSQVSGRWLIFAIVLIIFMGFGAGYVIVRPLLENHAR